MVKILGHLSLAMDWLLARSDMKGFSDWLDNQSLKRDIEVSGWISIPETMLLAD